jgi:hypothetical protein
MVLWFPWWFILVVGQTMWQRTPSMVHPSWFWWSPNGSTSGEFFFNLKYLEFFFFEQLRLGGGSGFMVGLCMGFVSGLGVCC